METGSSLLSPNEQKSALVVRFCCHRRNEPRRLGASDFDQEISKLCGRRSPSLVHGCEVPIREREYRRAAAAGDLLAVIETYMMNMRLRMATLG